MIRENEILLSMNRDPLYFRFVNCARGTPPPPPPLYDPLNVQLHSKGLETSRKLTWVGRFNNAFSGIVTLTLPGVFQGKKLTHLPG